MYTLYGKRGSGSAAVEAVLGELGLPFDAVWIDTSAGEHRSESFRRINPRQQVPALRHPDGTIITEGAAILLHLADAHADHGLAPPPGTSERAQHDRWLLFFACNVYEGELRHFYPDRYTTDVDGADSVMKAAESYVQRHFLLFEEELGPGPYLRGPQVSVLDFYIWMLVNWGERDWFRTNAPKVLALADAVADRPRIVAVQQANFG